MTKELRLLKFLADQAGLRRKELEYLLRFGRPIKLGLSESTKEKE